RCDTAARDAHAGPDPPAVDGEYEEEHDAEQSHDAAGERERLCAHQVGRRDAARPVEAREAAIERRVPRLAGSGRWCRGTLRYGLRRGWTRSGRRRGGSTLRRGSTACPQVVDG